MRIKFKKESLKILFSSVFISSIPFFDIPRTFTDGITLSIILSTLAPLFIFHKLNKIPKETLTLFSIFIICYIASYFINIRNFSDKGLNHIVLYILSFYTYYIVFFLSLNQIGFEKTKKLICYGLFILALIGAAEFLSFYIYGFDYYANFLDHGQNIGTFINFLPRVRSLFNEPSHLAIYLLGIAPFIISSHSFYKFIWLILMISTFATSSIFACCLSLFLILIYKQFIKPSIFSLLILMIILITTITNYEYISESAIFEKITNISSLDPIRWEAFEKSIPYIMENPFFGWGPTFYYEYAPTGLFNLYLQHFIEGGIILALTFIIFLIFHLFYINKKRLFLKFIFLSIIFTYISMNHYYLPGIWVFLAYLGYTKVIGNPPINHRSEK